MSSPVYRDDFPARLRQRCPLWIGDLLQITGKAEFCHAAGDFYLRSTLQYWYNGGDGSKVQYFLPPRFIDVLKYQLTAATPDQLFIAFAARAGSHPILKSKLNFSLHRPEFAQYRRVTAPSGIRNSPLIGSHLSSAYRLYGA